MTTVVMVLLMLSVAFGGSGAAVYAAQDAMPNDPLYGIKLTSEDVRVQTESNVQTRAELMLEFANRRMNEIATMAYNGIVPPDAIMERQQLQIQNALQETAGLDDPTMNRILLRTQSMLQEQVQTCDRLRTRASDSVTPTLDRVREQLRLQLQLTDLGLHEPQQFRTQVRQATREQIQERQQQQPTAQPKPTPAPPQPTAAQQQQRQSSASAQPTAVQQQNQNQNQQQSQSSAQAQPTAAQQQNQQQGQSSSQQQNQNQQQNQSSSQQQNQNQQQNQSSAQSQSQSPQQQTGGGSSSASSNQSGKR